MDSLQINTGEKHVPIIRDGASVGELVFNPSDVVFREKFYKLIGDFQTTLTEYRKRGESVDANQAMDENGLPANALARMALEHEACTYIREQIDYLFGAGISQKLFGNSMVLRVNENTPGPFEQFFTGITPFIQSATNARVEKYTNKPQKRVKK